MLPDLARLAALVRAGLGFGADVSPLRDDEGSIWRLARDHRVAAVLSPGILDSGAAPGLADEARTLWQLAALRAEYYAKGCEEICRRFRSEGVRVAPLKGIVLAREAYPKPGQRTFSDLDLLVRPCDLPKADRLLLGDGFRRFTPPGALPRAVRVKGDPLAAAAAGIDAVSYCRDDLAVELHTSILPRGLGIYPLEEAWNSPRGLSAEDFLIHLFFQATRHHFLSGLRHLADAAVWFPAKKPDVGVVERRLKEAGLVHLAWPAWKLSAEFFPGTVPEPPAAEDRIVRAYTDRVRKKFASIPGLAVGFSCSPLPFFLMQPNRVRRLVAVVRGSDVQASFQLGNRHRGWRRWTWIAARPVGLLWRHAPVLGRWLRFSL